MVESSYHTEESFINKRLFRAKLVFSFFFKLIFIGVYLLCIQFYCPVDCLGNVLSLLALQFPLPPGGRSERLKSRRRVSVLKGKESGVGLISSPLTPRIRHLVADLC